MVAATGNKFNLLNLVPAGGSDRYKNSQISTGRRDNPVLTQPTPPPLPPQPYPPSFIFQPHVSFLPHPPLSSFSLPSGYPFPLAPPLRAGCRPTPSGCRPAGAGPPGQRGHVEADGPQGCGTAGTWAARRAPDPKGASSARRGPSPAAKEQGGAEAFPGR